MLMLRLQRIGRRNEAHFRMVVIEKSKGPKSQKYIDIVGSYNPKLGNVQVDEEKVKKYLANGVQPSDTVYNMLVEKGIVEGKKLNVLPQKTPVISEKEETEESIQAEDGVEEISEPEIEETQTEELVEEKNEESLDSETEEKTDE